MTTVAVPWPAGGDPVKLGFYLESLRGAGGDPAVVPPGEPVPAFACLLLPGGGDLAPERYGQTADPHTNGIDPELDELELALARRALDEGVPVLAICRGIQVLNVAAGGDLIQHVGGHRGVVHPISARGILADLDGETVNSSHHQVIGSVAPGFEVLATAPDGVVEAFRHPGHPFALGVQWHPERAPRHPHLFAALAAAAHAG